MCEESKNLEPGNGRQDERKPRNLTRRGLIAGTAASVAGYLLSPCALAYAFEEYHDLGGGCPCSEGNPTLEFRRSEMSYDRDDEFMAYGTTGRSKTPVVRWRLSNWNCGLGYLGVGVASTVRCRYENALFCFTAFEPTVRAYSLARWSPSYYQGWHNIGNHDNDYRLYYKLPDDGNVSTQAAGVRCDIDLQDPPEGVAIYIDDPSNDGNSGALQERYSYDYVHWDKDRTPDSVNGATYNLRKGIDMGRTFDFRTEGDFYHFHCDYHGGGYENGHQITIQQSTGDKDWLCQKVPTVQICRHGIGTRPDCGIEWAGRIVAICDGNNERNSLLVGNGSDPASNGDTLQVWPKADGWPDASARLNRNWYVNLNTVGGETAAGWGLKTKWRGTLSILNVMQLNRGGGRNIDQDGGELAKAYSAKAQIWDTNGQANQAFWIHTVGGMQYIVSDASGLVLEHANWSDGRCVCGFHSEGTGADADFGNNGNHMWKLQDVVFRHRSEDGAINIGAKEQPVGNTLSVSGIEGQTYPFVGSGSTNLRYELIWVRAEKGTNLSYLSDNVYISAKAAYEYYGVSSASKPANNMVGALNLKALKGLELSVEGWNSYGGIAYRFKEYVEGDKNWTANWSEWVKDGNVTGTIDRTKDFRAVCFQAHLYGNLSRFYTLRYRAGNSLGWCKGWRNEGTILIAPQEDKPGHTIKNAYIQSLAIEVVPRAEVLKEVAYDSTHHPTDMVIGSDTTPSPWSGSGTTRTLTADDHGKKFAGVMRAVIPSGDYDEPSYLGFVRTSEVTCQSYCTIHFIADGRDELDTVYKHPVGTPYYFTSENVTNCTRPNVERLDYWYTDSGYKTKVTGSFTPNDYTKKDYYIYCRNVCKLTFQFADDTRSFFDANAPYKDKSFASSLARSSMMPSDREVYYGTSFTPSWSGKSTTAYVKGLVDGRAVQTDAIQSVFGDRSAVKSSTPLKTPLTITRSMTLYIVWTRATFDGFDSN